MSESGTLAYRVLSSSIARLISNGTRKILITSSGPGEGKSTIACRLSEALARSDRLRIAVVDADTFRPSLHKLFRLDHRIGLGELLAEVSEVSLNDDNSVKFGTGDWMELIRTQSKTGTLQISKGDEEFSATFNKGRLAKICESKGQRHVAARAHHEGSEPPHGGSAAPGHVEKGKSDVALQLELSDRLRRMLALSRPQSRFLAVPETYGSEARRGRTTNSGFAGIDRLVQEIVRDENQPYLSTLVSRHLKNTALESLKVLTCGDRRVDLSDFYCAEAFRALIDYLARNFDAVLVDAPPVAFDTSTSSLAPALDGVLLVVKAEGFEIAVHQRAKNQLLRSGANLLGVVLNQVDLPKEAAYPYYQGSFSEPA